MKEKLSKQYNKLAKDFSLNQKRKNQTSRNEMYKYVGKNLSGLKILDLACGDGTDVNYYSKLKGQVIGIDSSNELLKIAKIKYPNNLFTYGLGENMPFKNDYFDAVYSKYAIMTSKNIEPIFEEVYRVLKKGGIFIYLVTHPFRQFIERKENNTDYFKQKVVNSIILDGTVKLKEPTHTMNEYFNKTFFERFELIDFKESWDPAAEQIGGNKYPCYFIVKTRKK